MCDEQVSYYHLVAVSEIVLSNQIVSFNISDQVRLLANSYSEVIQNLILSIQIN